MKEIKTTFAAIIAFCGCLAAQEISIAVLEPVGGRDARNHASLVRNQIVQTITGTKGFQLMDRARTDQILREHDFQRNTGLISSDQARELGKMLGVDYIVTSELNKHDDDLEISCQALDIVTGRVVASGSGLVEEVTAKSIMESTQDLMGSLLKSLNTNVSGAARRGSSGGSSENNMLSGLDDEIRTIVANNRSIPKWNINRNNYMLEVDLSGVTLNENRQFGIPTYRVSGTVHFFLSDSESGNNSGADLELEEFTEMSKDLVHKKIKSQLQPKIINIIRELLAGLD
ncbi:MAG: penicillin-binding protein activator LpoB [Holophagales bacterium]|jgi:TolB-like protein|nr:penicillin-binding protein activator LpoB [Holophagales bacterium]